MMKPGKSSTRTVRRRDGKSLLRPYAQPRRRSTVLNLEALEERTLLSTLPSDASATLDLNQTGANATVGSSNSPSTTVDTTVSTNLAASVKDASTVATVVVGPSSTATNDPASTSALNPHIYTGQPSDFVGPLPSSSSAAGQGSTSNPGQYNPNQPSQTALAALSKSLDAQPQYFVLPTSNGSATEAVPDQGEGPGGGYTPQQLQGAYGTNLIQFGQIQGDGAGQTIAVIDAGDNPDFLSTSDPNFDSSALHIFDQEFGLPDPPSFQKYDEYGNLGGTGTVVPGWGPEIAIDVEWAHAMAPAANIVLVEGYSSSLDDLMTANLTAATLLGADVISNSWGYYLEYEGDGAEETYLDNTYLAPALAANPGVTFLASSGDGGGAYGVLYPSISPDMVGAGGTSLDATGNTWTNEYTWSGGGGGVSTNYSAPAYQQAVTGNSARTSPDFSSDANPYTGVSVYDPYDYGGWVVFGGTSVASPTLAGELAIADQGRTLLGGAPLNGPNQTLPGLYSDIDYTNYYHDITQTGSGPEEGDNGFPVTPGYDLDTGIGSPQSNDLIPYLSLYDLGPAVVSSNPAASQVVTQTPPTTFSLTFSEPVDPNSVIASDFTVNGVPADSDYLSPDGLTITYTFDTSPVTQQGSQTMYLPADSVIGADDGQPNIAAFSASFYYVVNQLQVSATSPPVGSVLEVPVTDLVVQFNKAFNPYSISTSDFQLSQGSVVGAVPLTPESIDLTLSGITQDGSLTLTIPVGGILDTFGVPNAAFTGTYVVDIVSEPYPTPLQGEKPAGSLIYDPMVTGSVGFVGDTDTYTLSLVANQTLSLVMTTAPNLIGMVTLLGPDGSAIASATAPAAGDDAVLQTAPITTAGTYSLVVSGSAGTTGNYTLQAILNAAYKQATDTNNSIASAYDLTNAFASLGTTPSADRAGVLGTIDSSGDSDYYKFYLNAGQSTTLAAQGLNGDVSLGLLDGSGDILALPTGASYSDGVNLGGGFSGPIGMTLNGNANISGTSLDLTDGNYSEAGSAFTNSVLNVGSFTTSFDFQVLQTLTNPLADGFTFTIQGNGPTALGNGGGDLGYGGIGNSVCIKFDYYNNAGEGTDSTGLFTDGADPYVPAIDLTGTGVNLSSGDPMNVSMNYDGSTLNVTIMDLDTDASASQSYTVNIPSIVGGPTAYVGFTGGDGGLTSIPAILNWTYTPAQATIGTASFESINNFVAPTSGWYYAEVGGDPGTNYSLVVTQDADFTLHGSSFTKAQPLNGTDVALGAIVPGLPALQALDDITGSPSNIYATDPTTGAFGSSIPAPVPGGFYLFGQNMATDGTYTYYSDGYGGSGTIFKLDASGNVVASVTPTNGDLYTGLAYLDGLLYAVNIENNSIDVFDASTLTYVTTIQTGITDSDLVGLAGDPDLGVLFAVGQTGGTGDLYELDPSTGSVIMEGQDNNQGLYEQDLAYANGLLIVSDTNGLAGAGNNYLDEYDPSTFAFVQRVAPPYVGAASGLAGDGGAGQSGDWYQFNVNAGDNLVITTTTPGDNSGNGDQFFNDLHPTLNLYDASGNLVATATGNASDGNNDVIDWTALTSGSYRVQIIGSTPTNLGEYTIGIQGATGGASPFQVTSTNPAAGSDVGYQVSTMTVSFNSNVLFSSANTSDFMIDGNDATGVTASSGNSVTFSFPTTSNGVHSVSISGLESLQGVPMSPDSFTFETDDVAPVVVSSSIADGSVLPPGALTEVITFNEPIQPSSVSASDISLVGEVRGINYTPSSISFDPTDTILTIDYTNLPTDAYQFTLVAGPDNFLSQAGVPLQNDFVVNFTMPAGTSTVTGLQPVLPLGSLVYQTTIDNLLLSSSDVDIYDLPIDPQQTLAVMATPVSSSMSVTVTLISPTGNVLGSATSPSPGAPAILPGLESSKGGTYEIEISGGPGEYTVTPTLNALIDTAAYGGANHNTIATALPIDPYANKVAGNDTETAVLGGITGSPVSAGDAFVAAPGNESIDVVSDTTGQIINEIPISGDTYESLRGIELGPNDVLYAGITTSFNTGSVSGELLEFSLSGKPLGSVQLPNDPANNFYYYPYGFAVASDGSFWVAQPNSGNVAHVSPTGSLIASYSVGGIPEAVSIRSDGEILVSQTYYGEVQVLDPSSGSVSTFVSSDEPYMLNPAGSGGNWIGDFDEGGIRVDNNGNFLQQAGYLGTIQNQNDPSGNIWSSNAYGYLYQFDPTGTIQQFATSIPGGSVGLTVMGVDAPLPPSSGNPVYSFSLDQGVSATIAVNSLNGMNVSFSLYDEDGDLLAVSSPGATNYTAGLNNFVSPADGTYYIQVSGSPGLQFNLVLTRGADFTTQPHSTIATAQDITATEQSGDNKLGGVVGDIQNPSGATLGTNFEGLSFDDSPCNCLPPNDIIAVGPTEVMDAVNTVFRITDKAGNTLMQEDFSTFWAPLGITTSSFISDPYVVYDPLAQRFYVTMLGGPDDTHLDMLFAVSNDSNPTDGFSLMEKIHYTITDNDDLDFPKVGFNYDTVMLEANDFVDGENPEYTVFAAIDKAQLLQGNFVDYQYYLPGYPQNFRATVPAQMDDATPGEPMYFIQEDGYENGSAAEVVTLTDALSNTPDWVDTVIPVDPYGPTTYSDQPGAPGSVQSIDTTFSRAQIVDGMLVATQTVTTPADDYTTDKVRWYEISITGTPTLVQQGTIDPGPGIATYNGQIAINADGALGVTYMQSSLTQYVSMYVTGQVPGAPLGTMSPGILVQAGSLSQPESFRTGDYSGIALDPSDDLTFWAINQYYGPDINNIWNTWVASFQVQQTIGTDFYSVNANAGDNLSFSTTTPAGGPNEFVNNLYPELLLYDPNGNLVAIAAGNAADGRNSVIQFTVPDGDAGKWTIEVTSSPNTSLPTQGEYGLLVTGATGALSPYYVTATTPASGALVQPPSTITVTFNEPVYVPSLTAGELEVNGVAATAVTDVNGNTVSWTIPASAYATGVDLPNVVTIGADASGNQVMDVSGQTLTPYSYTFFTTNVPPVIVSSSIDGQVFSPAPANVTEVVTFSQPMNTSFTTASSFEPAGQLSQRAIRGRVV